MSEIEKTDAKRKRIYCNKCGLLTNHTLCGEHQTIFDEVEGSQLLYWEELTYRMWICAGCDTGTLEEAYLIAFNADIQEPYTYIYFPKRETGHLQVKPYKQLPKNLAETYRECVLSFNAGLSLLCAAGLRALIEGICKSKEITGKNLEKKIDGLDRLLPRNIVDSLHSFRFMGNYAVHELERPALKDLKIAVEVCEDLLNFLYDLDYKAKSLPQRKASTSASKPSSGSPGHVP